MNRSHSAIANDYIAVPHHDEGDEGHEWGGNASLRRIHSCTTTNLGQEPPTTNSCGHSRQDENDTYSSSQNGTTASKENDVIAAEISPLEGSRDGRISPRDPKKKDLPPALDGGWGWMCVFGCWFMHFLLGGFGRSFGLVYVEMLHRFECSATIGSTIGGLFTAVRMCTGPLVAILMKRFSIRTVTGVGALVFASGAIMSGFATSATYMFISYGLLSGLGGALVYFPAIIIVGQYFDRRRGVAMGLSTAGSGIGCVAMLPLYHLMFRNYGWQGTFINVGGVLLNLAVCAALYRPLTLKRKEKYKGKIEEGETSGSQRESDDTVQNQLVEVKNSQNWALEVQLVQNQSPDVQVVQNQSLDDQLLIENSATPGAETKIVTMSQNKSPQVQLVQNQSLDVQLVKNQSPDDRLVQNHSPDVQHIQFENPGTPGSETPIVTRSQDYETGDDDLIIISDNDLISVKETVKKIHNGETTQDVLPLNLSLLRSQNLCAKFVSYFELNLLLRPVLVSYLLALTLATMAYLSAQNLILAHAIDKRVEAHMSVYVLSIVGASDTIGRVLSGFVYDIPCVRRRRSYLYAFILVGSGLSILGWAFCHTFVELAILGAANGLFNGAIVAGRPIIVADLVGMKHMTSAFSMTVFFQGVGIMVGPFIAGYLKDLTGTYFMSFVFASGCSCFGGLIFFICYSCDAFYARREHANLNQVLPIG